MKTSFELAVETYNRLVRLYYEVRMTKPGNKNKLLVMQNYVNQINNDMKNIELMVERGHLWMRDIPKKYYDKIKYKKFKPLGYVIDYPIDFDMFIAIIHRIINFTLKTIVNKIISGAVFDKVIFAISTATENRNKTKRHVEAHMVCNVPHGTINEMESKAIGLLKKFVSCVGYDFMIQTISFKDGADIVSTGVKESDLVVFKLYDYNYPSKRLEVPLKNFADVEVYRTPGVKADAVIRVKNWWEHTSRIKDVLCGYCNTYY